MTGKSHFQIVNGLTPRQPIDLIPLPSDSRPSASADSFAQHIFDLHAETLSNASYKFAVDTHRRTKDFNEGDYVLVRVLSERFPPHSFKKLHARAIGPYRIIQKLGPNAYRVDLPADLHISSAFNVEDLFPYCGTFTPPFPSEIPTTTLTPPVPCLPPTPSPPSDRIESVLDHEIVTSLDGGYNCYLVW
ncbi:hypothetical protein J5N97_022655 [Dioscorea zingiberensis]|uniref:Tf2-1-like SH3-like domain-containing protein n=1 Tax=Dioscorea zingiberensis TaxID=325984 RepID=A0A9D5CAT3_9LILI|nr:hypothetical protein J5N97_022655 [Dioscorea zingiberensis]